MHRDWAKTNKVGIYNVMQYNAITMQYSNTYYGMFLGLHGVSKAWPQVSVRKVNKEKLFAKKYPKAAKQITSHREMEAGWLTMLPFSACFSMLQHVATSTQVDWPTP